MSLPVQTASALHVLVIDDDDVDRAHVRRALERAAPQVEFTFAEAESAPRARTLAAEGMFDCILLDYLLPGTRATELFPTLAALQPDAAIVVLTGQGDATVAVELMKAGVSDYLPKDGLDPARLWTAVRYAVALSRVKRDTMHFEQARRRRTEQLRRLVEAAPSISGMLTPEELARVAAERTRDVLGVRESFVTLRDRDVEAFHCATRAGVKPSVEAEEWLTCCRTTRVNRQPAHLALGSGRRALAVGLFDHEGASIGCIAACEPEEYVDEEDCGQILAQLAQIVSVALENARLLRQTQLAVRARDEVLAVVSHDLRTPLSNVRLSMGLLRQEPPDRDLTLIERIERNVHHMTRLVDDLVDLARIEGSRLVVMPMSESVLEILPGALALVQPIADAAGVELIADQPTPELRVRADRHRILQVLSNLLINAIKFTPRGGRVQLGCEERSAEICFHVRDTGCGIGAADAPNVFGRFFRGTAVRHAGLGLGLYIAKAVVDAHSGSIWFTSSPGRGTTFSFTLPRDSTTVTRGTLLESTGP